MRVLMLTDFFPPQGGGLELCVQTLARELVARSHSVSVVTLAQPGMPATESIDGMQLHRVDGWSRALLPFYRDPSLRFLPPVPDPGVVSRIREIVDDEHPDVIHGHSWIMSSYIATRGTRVAAVQTLHDYGLSCVTKTLMRAGRPCDGPEFAKCIRCAERFYGVGKGTALAIAHRASLPRNGRIDRYIAISDAVATASASATRGVPLDVIPSFIPDDTAKVASQAPRPSFVPADDYVLFVGSDSAHKGMDLVLKAQAATRHRMPLVCIGVSAPATETDAVTFVPRARHEEVLAAFRHCRIAVVPSQWPEPFGLVAVEAMAIGRPVVVAAHGGLVEIVDHGRNGLVAPPGDVAAWASALDRLWDDPALAASLGENARMTAERYTASAVVPSIEQVYERALADRRGATTRTEAAS